MDSVADELYGLPRAEFTTRRDVLAAEAQRLGEPELAGAIKKLRRPTLGAWLANALVREHRDQLSQLLDLGATMRKAHEGRDASELRRLSQERHRAVAALVDKARGLAAGRGVAVSGATSRELEATLEAALADVGAAEDLRAGRLSTALQYSGLGALWPTGPEGGSIGPTGRTAPGPPPPGEPSLGAPEARSTRRGQPSTQAAQGALVEAEAALAGAKEAEAEETRHLSQARSDVEQRQRELTELELRLHDLREAARGAGRKLLEAEVASREASQRSQAARERVAQARSALERLARAASSPALSPETGLCLRADARTTSQFRVASSPGADGVVAAGLGVVTADRQVLHLLVADLGASGVVGPDEVGVDPQPCLGPGGADVVDDGLVVG